MFRFSTPYFLDLWILGLSEIRGWQGKTTIIGPLNLLTFADSSTYTNKYQKNTEIETYRLHWPRGWLSKNRRIEFVLSNSFVAERSAASSAAAVGRGGCHKLPLSAIPGIRCNVQVGGSSRLTDFGPIDGPREWDTNTTASRRSNRYGHISICLLLECLLPLKRN